MSVFSAKFKGLAVGVYPVRGTIQVIHEATGRNWVCWLELSTRIYSSNEKMGFCWRTMIDMVAIPSTPFLLVFLPK
jgi:hypothetical protein